jgi:hypothetical protein
MQSTDESEGNSREPSQVTLFLFSHCTLLLVSFGRSFAHNQSLQITQNHRSRQVGAVPIFAITILNVNTGFQSERIYSFLDLSSEVLLTPAIYFSRNLACKTIRCFQGDDC